MLRKKQQQKQKKEQKQKEKQMTEFFEKIKSEFEVPEFYEHKIRYVKNRDDADVMVSCGHTLGDYLILGAAALEKSIFLKQACTIKVYNQKPWEARKEIVTIYRENNIMEKTTINSELYLQIYEMIDRIYAETYKGSTPVGLLGLAITTTLPMNLIGKGNMDPKFFDDMMFENFDDLISAQKNMFDLIVEVVAGSLTAIFLGEFD